MNKPTNFELMSFGAYVVFATAAVLITRTNHKKTEEIDTGSTTAQSHSGSGDNVGVDKIIGDKIAGDKIFYHHPDKKKINPKP